MKNSQHQATFSILKTYSIVFSLVNDPAGDEPVGDAVGERGVDRRREPVRVERLHVLGRKHFNSMGSFWPEKYSRRIQ